MKLVFVPLKDVFKECKGKRQFSIKKDAYRRFSSVSNEMQIGIKKIAALYIRLIRVLHRMPHWMPSNASLNRMAYWIPSTSRT
ncbi:icmF-like domain protein [Escherichia coli 2-474-04_S3_C1]|nr:icmF-like domain protein [Escherichia coli 2-474-04_S3_C1]KDZ11500.1 icmF-like domain protein [Escherichia coli 2-474-04_S3_C3]